MNGNGFIIAGEDTVDELLVGLFGEEAYEGSYHKAEYHNESTAVDGGLEPRGEYRLCKHIKEHNSRTERKAYPNCSNGSFFAV